MKNKFLYKKCIPYSIAVVSIKEDKLVLITDRNMEKELNEINEEFQSDEIEYNEFIKQTNECLDHYFSLYYAS